MKKLVMEQVTKRKSKTTVYKTEVKQYVYSTDEERNKHSKEMQEKGYKDSGQVLRMKAGTNILLDAEREDAYEWFGSYYKESKQEIR